MATSSQLSKRLLQAHARSGVSESGISPQQPASTHKFPPKSASAPSSLSGSRAENGYSADRESNASSTIPPVFSIDFLSRNKKRESRGTPASERSKRLKVQEMNYSAATAKSELTRAGLKVPLLKKESMKVVDHRYSSAVADSPYLYSNAAPKMDDVSPLASIIDSCDAFYAALPKIPAATESDNSQQNRSPSEYESSTSSVTDNDENSDSSVSGEEAKTKVVSMGEALSLSKEARYVTSGSALPQFSRNAHILFCSVITLSQAPYTVIHVNATFTKLTGLPSVKALGRPFKDLIENDNMLRILEQSSQTLSSTIVHDQGMKKRTQTKKPEYVPCTISVSPVGSPYQAATHLAMELRVGDSEHGRHCSFDMVSAGSSTANHAMKVFA